MAHYFKNDKEQTVSNVCKPVIQIKGRVESIFHEIGGLLDELAGVAAAFQGFLRQDLDAGVELPRYSQEFTKGLAELESRIDADRRSLGELGTAADELKRYLPDIVSHAIHLRSCTFTLKVVSARYPEISGFAEEMAGCVNRIRASAEALTRPLDVILSAGSSELAQGVDVSAPPSLDEVFRSEPAEMRIAAQEIDQMISQLMSTLQGGDIASQRLDHIARGAEAIEDAALGPGDRRRFMAMLDDQFAQTIAELASNCGMFTENIDLIARRIEVLAANADVHRVGLAENYRGLQHRIDAYFAGLIKLHEHRMACEAALNGRGGDAGPDMIEAEIESMRAAVLDNYYMALNTTLSCGRLGADASSAAPVTAEIRYHVIHLGDVVDQMAQTLPGLKDAHASCSMVRDEVIAPVYAAEHSRLASQTAAMAERSRQAWLSPGRLHELSRQILAEIPRLGMVSENAPDVQQHLAQYRGAEREGIAEQRKVDALSETIFAMYTMNSEREVHKRHFHVDIDSSDCEAINLFGDGPELDLSSVLF